MKNDDHRMSSHKPASKERSKRMNPNYKRFLYFVNLLVMSAVTIAALAASIYMLGKQLSAEEENALLQARLDAIQGEDKSLYTAEEVEREIEEAREEGAEAERSQILLQIQSDMASGNSTASMLRKLFSDDLVVVSGGKYYFYPIDDELGRNTYSSEDFALGEDGRLSYTGSGQVHLQTGMDVSSASGDIDWETVSEDDITFVMVDAGGRLTADSDEGDAGDLAEDEMFTENITGAAAAGLGTGAFWNLGATSEDEALEEADVLLELLSDVKSSITLPVAVCVNVPAETDRTSGQGRADWTGYVTIVCEALEEAGYQPMIYGNLASFVMMLDLEELEPYGWSRWISNTGASLYFPYEFSLWEYSTSGAVQGVSTEVTLNAYFAS